MDESGIKLVELVLFDIFKSNRMSVLNNFWGDTEVATQDAEATSHYIEVGEGKIRKNMKSEGRLNEKKVSRKDLGYTSTSEEELLDDENSASENKEADTESDNDVDGDSNEESEEESVADDNIQKEANDDLELMRQIENKESESALLSSLIQTSKLDRIQGEVVKKQLSAWNRILKVRIRFQDELGRINEDSMKDLERDDVKARGMIDLFEELMQMRIELADEELVSEKTLQTMKRKRDVSDIDEWRKSTKETMMEIEVGLEENRMALVDKWSKKVMATNSTDKKFKVINTSIVSQLEGLEGDREKLLQRTRLNRGRSRIGEEKEHDSKDNHLNNYDERIFDDGDFYQKLLKEFVDSRVDSNVVDDQVAALRTANLKKLQRDRHPKKNVDTRASKGRKVRYVVMEKIQNFMAPEPRGDWHEEMSLELFASLFGKEAKANKVDILDGFKLF